MKATRFASLITAAALSTASLVSAPAAGAEEAVAPTAQTTQTAQGSSLQGTANNKPDPSNPDPDMAVMPKTPWLRILEGSSQGPAGVIIAILFGIVSIGLAAYKEFGDYLPKLG
ncbi:hypothetical protein [Corynebacterium hesseae]|uniref:hypothetical protein n=1 Tax=Corynebacterium hesseae TaxID=2913502 RepID=UPI0022BA0520|nr:hypothetical protein [Corynebacterium hesseae]MCZ9297962.1 hypothetical protein [Corynebacterium hesseae]